MFRPRISRQDSPVSHPRIGYSASPRRSESDYDTFNWKAVLRKFKRSLFGNKEESKPDFGRHILYAPLDSPSLPTPRLEPRPIVRRHTSQVAWPTPTEDESDLRAGPPVPPKDKRGDPPSTFLKRAISRSKHQTQSVSYGKPVIVNITNPHRDSSPPAYTSHLANTEDASHRRRSSPSVPRRPVGVPISEIQRQRPKSAAFPSYQKESTAVIVQPDPPTAGEHYIPTHAGKDHLSRPRPRSAAFPSHSQSYTEGMVEVQTQAAFVPTHVGRGHLPQPRSDLSLREYAHARLEGKLGPSPLPSPTDYETFLEASRKAALRISEARWDREERNTGVWGVMDDITRSSPAPVVARERPASMALSRSASRASRTGRPPSLAGSIVDRVVEYIKPSRPTSSYGMQGATEEEMKSKRWSFTGSLSSGREGNTSRERARLQKGGGRWRGNEPPTSVGLQRFNMLAEGYN